MSKKILFRKKEHPESALKKVLETTYKKNDMPPFLIKEIHFFFVILNKSILTSVTPISSYPARALRALGLLLADGALTVGRGKTL